MELNSEEGLYCSFFGFSYLSQFLFNFSLSLMVFPLVALKLLSEIIECEVCTPPDVLHKEKNVVYPFHVFEKGSTSDTSNESSATSFEPILADVDDSSADYTSFVSLNVNPTGHSAVIENRNW
ncbi:uncharacterized protein LOC107784450 isoform X10 [Nicotiana tabacum]|uniref:Uncharacterized protein LOC107784450 isoform X10 n=1 Tax=Nicotiana tabacum TaxID=4097 RepID=A0AC58RLE3_TOBAC